MKSPTFSVCIDAVFEGLPEIEALHRLDAAGISAFEFWKWWDKDLNAIADTKEELGLQLAGFCTKFVSLVDPKERNAYLDALGETIETAKGLGAAVIISQVGDELDGIAREAQHECLIEGLQAAAPMVEEAGLVLAFEPLNLLVNHAGYYLSQSSEAFEIARKVDSPAVKVLFDIYHQQITEGHLIANLSANIDLIAHFHAAGNPGRNELDRGEIHYPTIFEAIAASSYKGFIGLEYWPLDNPEEGLAKCLEWSNPRA